MTRTSVRSPGNAKPVELWGFDRGQAEYLKNYFDALPHTTATMVRVRIAIDLTPKSKGERPVTVWTPEEQEAWLAEQRRKDAERKREARRSAAACSSFRHINR